MLNATSLDPRLSSNFDTQLRFDCAHDLFAWCFAPSIWKKPSSYCLKGSDRSSKIILYLHNAGQNRITQSIYEVRVYNERLVAFQNKPREPFCLCCTQPSVEALKISPVAWSQASL